MSYISSFVRLSPPISYSQEEIFRFLCGGKEDAFYHSLLHSTRIAKRGSCVALDDLKGPISLEERMRLFDERLYELFPQFSLSSPHLFHVSCTGYVAPSPAQRYAAEKAPDTTVTHLYHMGCYGSLPALRLAKGMHLPVDIVHTELCSVHLNRSLETKEQKLAQMLFGDGLIKYTATPSPPLSPSFKLLDLREILIPNTSQEMGWNLTGSGFKLSLSKEVPRTIAKHLPRFVDLFAPMQKERALFAIHPGGPKIIDAITALLHLEPWQVEHSRRVLCEHGNMSSATLPHIWEKILFDATIEAKTQIVSLAFGPGLTISGALMEKV